MKPTCAGAGNPRVPKGVETKKISELRICWRIYFSDRCFSVLVQHCACILFASFPHLPPLVAVTVIFAVPRGFGLSYVYILSPLSAATCVGFAGCAAVSKVLMSNPATKCTAATCTTGECCVTRKRSPPLFFPTLQPAHRRVLSEFSCASSKQAGKRQPTSKRRCTRRADTVHRFLALRGDSMYLVFHISHIVAAAAVTCTRASQTAWPGCYVFKDKDRSFLYFDFLIQMGAAKPLDDISDGIAFASV